MSASRFAVAATLAAATISAIPFDPDFYNTEWTGACASGQYQTPINIDSAAKGTPVPKALVTDMVFPSVQGVKLSNVGNGEKYSWDSVDMDSLPTVRAGGDGISAVLLDPTVPIDREVKVQPVQFHLHSVSEHVIDGLYYAAEAHIVSFVAKGEAPEWGCDDVWDGGDAVLERCTAVFGTMFKLGTDNDAGEPAWLAKSIEEGPEVVDDKGYSLFSEGVLDLNTLIPEDRSYYTYYGSLTTPPCAEGLRWHVFSTPLTITPATYEAMQNYVAFSKEAPASEETLGYRTNERYVQPLNGRTVWFHASGSHSAEDLMDASDDETMGDAAVGEYGDAFDSTSTMGGARATRTNAAAGAGDLAPIDVDSEGASNTASAGVIVAGVVVAGVAVLMAGVAAVVYPKRRAAAAASVAGSGSLSTQGF